MMVGRMLCQEACGAGGFERLKDPGYRPPWREEFRLPCRAASVKAFLLLLCTPFPTVTHTHVQAHTHPHPPYATIYIYPTVLFTWQPRWPFKFKF